MWPRPNIRWHRVPDGAVLRLIEGPGAIDRAGPDAHNRPLVLWFAEAVMCRIRAGVAQW